MEVQIERLSGTQCPLNLNDPKAVADGQSNTWAYVVYPESGRD
jgi:hypothetical protein